MSLNYCDPLTPTLSRWGWEHLLLMIHTARKLPSPHPPRRRGACPSDMTTPTQSWRQGLLPLLGCIFIFASIPIFLKSFTDDLDAWTVNGIRYTCAALIWAPYVWRQRRNYDHDGVVIWKAALLPALANMASQTGWALAPYYNDASVISFIIRCAFGFTILFGFFFLHEERSLLRRPVFWLGCAGIVAGVFALYWGGVQLENMTPLGIAILVVNAACWGLYAVMVKKYVSMFPARLSFGVISLYTAAGLIVMALCLGDIGEMATVTPATYGWMALSAVLGIAVGQVLLYRAIYTVGPVVTEGAFSLVPFVAAIAAFIILGEQLSGLQWTGGIVLALSSLALVRAKASSQR